jgi:hypothetical protein
MAQDSKVKRYTRRLKRENTLLYNQTVLMQAQMQQLAQMVMKSQKDWQDLKATLEAEEQADMQPTPSLTITRVEDEADAIADDSATS